MGARRKARELALQMLFENDVAGTRADEMFRRSPDLQKAPAALRDFTERHAETFFEAGSLLLIAGIDAATGEELWIHNEREGARATPSSLRRRGSSD